MTSILDAIWWQGELASIDLFLLSGARHAPTVDWSVEGVAPDADSVWPLEDEDGTLKSGHLYAYRLEFASLPSNFAEYLKIILRKSCSGPGRLAWLGFEGTFSFDELFTDYASRNIYGACVAGGEPVVTLVGEDLKTPDWKIMISELRAHLDFA